MKTKKDYSKIYSIIFIILCSIGYLIFDCCIIKQKKSLYLLIGTLFCITIIKLIEKHFYNNDDKIYSNKKALIPFFIEVLIFLILVMNRNQLIQYKIFLKIFFLSTVFISYLFKIKLENFNWKTNIKSLVFIWIIFLVYQALPSFIGKINNPISVYMETNTFITSFLSKSLYPGLFEEVMFRGFLISGLKAYGIKENNINIIQATLFGILHFSLYLPLGIIGIITGICIQALMGYIFGKVYFKTKSLTPCILLHGLIDVQV